MSCCRQKIAMLFLLLFITGCALVPVEDGPALQIGTVQKPYEVRGLLQQDLYLGGVIRITGDLFVPTGRSLQIAPGSHVLVVGNDSTKIDPEYLDKGTEILVKGRLIIAGKKGLPVKFSLDDSTPQGENWTGFELVAAEAAIFNYVDILGAEIGILSLDSSPQLTQVNILGARYGILMQGGGELVYRGGRISSGDAGLLCFDHSALSLVQMSIVDNLEEGLYLASGCSLQQQGLQINRNDLGAVASESYRTSLQVSLGDNRIDFKPLPGDAIQ